MKEAVADEREVRLAVCEGDDLSIEVRLGWKLGKLPQERGHVPAAPRADLEVSVPADERAEAVPLDLERVVAGRDRTRAREHR
jgi:hypothetical protein